MKDTVIRLENVSKYYKLYDSPKDRLKEALHPFGKKYHREFFAIKNISLTVQRGEVLGIVGRNGSGKSTLLKLISSVLVPSSGTLTVQGKVNALLELGSGLNPQFTGLQNIYLMGSINGIAQHDMEEKIKEIIEFSELGEFIHQPLKSYSSGMKAKLAFALATSILPEILILDEVLSVGDALFRRKSFARMEQLISENRTVLFVSHNEESVKSICTRAILLDGGEMLYSGEPAETVNYYTELLHSKNRKKVIEQKILRKAPVQSNIEPEKNEEEVIQTKSKQYVKIHDAEIKDISIRTKTRGDRVKVLMNGEEYIIRVIVFLENAYDNVSLAMSIKNEKGIVVTGISPRLSGKTVDNKKKQASFVLEYNLTCCLCASVYFLDVFLMGDVGANNEVLCYVNDAVALKVIDSRTDAQMRFGLVSLVELVDVRS
ncbi:MAG: ABC transporter ATP-binding protein [Proteobacteria bacterium]|nr:ABC transporter ATP-binding protein [Desulfocapsa sp.]MBU3944449.1 ABC transporter ATP-binding protein [Pseudomonadota bacterium]MBU4028738.1 ABC transporter ATP-binding protein [Pseudomonadota bacterium]MBU4042226.1 ABC transporter ATP-binding protein [Pseudomonadota bacterium]MBU4084094.1 ABC transporter ATP-binding protein [Pseudomonadota bacterium]